MQFLDNIGENRLGNALAESLDEGSKLSIISSYFTVFAYGELKEELSKIDCVRFLFSEPTFVKRMEKDKAREFELAQKSREKVSQGLVLNSRYEITLTKNHLPNSVQTGLKKRVFLKLIL